MATNTPTLTRAERILELWRTDDEFVSARTYLDNGDIGNGSSEALGWLIDHHDARPSEEQWVDDCITAVQAAGAEAAVKAMAEKVAELIEQAPAGLIDGPKPYCRAAGIGPMTEDRDFERDVTRIVGMVAVIRPEVVEYTSNADLRRFAAKRLRESRGSRPDVPAVFRDAFRDR